MANKLYVVSYYGLNSQGEHLFDRGGYYTDANKARTAMEGYTDEFYFTLNTYLYPSRVSLYVHLIIRELEDGEYKYKKSAIYACCEECQTTIYKENPVFNELYRTTL